MEIFKIKDLYTELNNKIIETINEECNKKIVEYEELLYKNYPDIYTKNYGLLHIYRERDIFSFTINRQIINIYNMYMSIFNENRYIIDIWMVKKSIYTNNIYMIDNYGDIHDNLSFINNLNNTKILPSDYLKQYTNSFILPNIFIDHIKNSPIKKHLSEIINRDNLLKDIFLNIKNTAKQYITQINIIKNNYKHLLENNN